MARRAASGSASTSIPSMRARPASGRSTVYSMRKVVDFPAPLGPSRPVIRPSAALKLTSRTAATLPKRLASDSTSITARPR